MNYAGKLSDHLQLDKALINADITTDRDSGWFDMTNFRHAIARLETDDVDLASVATVAFEQATSAAGAGAKALGTVATGTAGSGGEALTVQKEIDVDEMDTANDFRWLRVTVTSDNSSAVIGSAELIRDRGRF